MIEENNTKAEAKEPYNASPAVNKDEENKGRIFTQDEVNRIVSERLARERERLTAEPSESDKREQALIIRENTCKCMEFILKDDKYPKELLEILDTSDFEEFKKKADKLITVFPKNNSKSARIVPVVGADVEESRINEIAEAFKPKI